MQERSSVVSYLQPRHSVSIQALSRETSRENLLHYSFTRRGHTNVWHILSPWHIPMYRQHYSLGIKQHRGCVQARHNNGVRDRLG